MDKILHDCISEPQEMCFCINEVMRILSINRMNLIGFLLDLGVPDSKYDKPPCCHHHVLGLAVSGKERIIGNGQMMDKSIETTQALLRCFCDAFEK